MKFTIVNIIKSKLNASVKAHATLISSKQLILCFALFLTFSSSGFGQAVSTYSFAQTSGTYSAFAGGTTIFAANNDDDESVLTNIGFTFYYHGMAFTQFSASPNGYICLGAVPSAISSPLSAHENCIAFCGGDGKTNTAVKYKLTGTSPNRILTIQYPDWYVYYGNTSNTLTAQIKLYETSNVIQIIYGSSAHVSSYTGQVGLSGATVNDFNNRTSTTSWSATTAGTLNTATMTWSSTVYPISGQTYTWTPSVCTAPSAPATNVNSLYSPYNGLEHHILQTYAAVSGVNGYEYSYSYDNSTWYVGSTSTLLNINWNVQDQPNQIFYTRVRAYQCTTPLYSGYTTSAAIYTACDEPAAPTVTALSTTSLNVTINTETPVANPAITTYAIYCTTTSQYVQADGSLGASAVWQTKAAWGTKTVTALSCGTSYAFYAIAKNNDGDQRYNASNTASATTSVCPPEMKVPAAGNNSYNICSGHLYDNGGSAAVYASSSDGYSVLYPGTAGNMIQLTGNYYTEAGWDSVIIYNGVGITGTVLFVGSTSSLSSIGTIASTDVSGTLTVRFKSDGSVQNSGFDFTISCVPSVSITGSSSICVGSTTTLSPTTGGSWVSNSPAIATVTNGGVVTGSAAGSATFTFTQTSTGSSNTTPAVTVKPLPSGVTASASLSSICQGSSVDLTSSATSNSFSNVNYLTEGFETWPPTDWTFINAGSGAYQWESHSSESYSGSASMYYNYDASFSANAWAISKGISLTSGTTYTVSFWYKAGLTSYPEKLKVTVGTLATVAGQSNVLWNCNGGTSLTNDTWQQGIATYTPSTSGTYYFGFNCYSAADMYYLYVDDLSISALESASPTFAWTSTPSGFTSAVQNPTGVAPSATTQYVVTASNSFGCTASASVSVNVTAVPANDLCANATNISSFPYSSGVLSTNCATNDVPAVGSSTCGAHDYNVWYKFTGNGNQMQISTCDGSTTFDTEIHVYTGSCGSMTEVICNDDGLGCSNGQSSFTMCTTNGTVYYISIGSYQTSGARGNYVLSVTEKTIGAATIIANSICGNGTVTLATNVGANADAVDFSIDGGSSVASTDASAPYEFTTASLTAPQTVTVYVRSKNSVSGCVGAWTNSAAANAYTAPSLTVNPLCNNDAARKVEIIGTGGSGVYSNYEQLSPLVSHASNIFAVPFSSTRSFRVTDDHGCISNWVPYTAPSGPNQIAGVAASGNCIVRGENNWWHVTDMTNQVIVSVNDNSNDLGHINAWSYIEPVTTYFNQSYYLKRHFKVSSENAPATNVTLRLYFTDTELNELIVNSKLNTNQSDDVDNLSDLKVTRYSGPNEDGNYANNDFACSSCFTVYGPTTGSATSFGADVKYVEISVPGFSEQWLHGGDNNTSVLPIELLSFTPQCLGNNGLIRWVTASEINNSHFIIQRSDNGVDYSDIAQIQGSGNSTQLTEYSYIDTQKPDGLVYYRLKQVDFDGTENSFSPKSLNCVNKTEELKVIPNPFREKISVVGLLTDDAQLEIFNAEGARVVSNTIHQTTSAEIDLSFLQPGMYLLKVTETNGKTYQFKLMKN